MCPQGDEGRADRNTALFGPFSVLERPFQKVEVLSAVQSP